MHLSTTQKVTCSPRSATVALNCHFLGQCSDEKSGSTAFCAFALSGGLSFSPIAVSRP